MRDLEVAEDAVMRMNAGRIREQAEEQKHVANASAIIVEVTLCRLGLADGAAALFKHGIVVAEVCAIEPTTGCSMDDWA